MARSSVTAVTSFWLARGGVSGLSTLKSALSTLKSALMQSRSLAARGGFPSHGGVEQPHRPILLCQLGLELASLG
jgi:hypothetical protein